MECKVPNCNRKGAHWFFGFCTKHVLDVDSSGTFLGKSEVAVKIKKIKETRTERAFRLSLEADRTRFTARPASETPPKDLKAPSIDFRCEFHTSIERCKKYGCLSR